jgi:hypothetical protein
VGGQGGGEDGVSTYKKGRAEEKEGGRRRRREGGGGGGRRGRGGRDIQASGGRGGGGGGGSKPLGRKGIDFVLAEEKGTFTRQKQMEAKGRRGGGQLKRRTKI